MFVRKCVGKKEVLVVKISADVAREMNLGNPLHTDEKKHVREGPTLGFNRAHWGPTNKFFYVLQTNFWKNIN